MAHPQDPQQFWIHGSGFMVLGTRTRVTSHQAPGPASDRGSFPLFWLTGTVGNVLGTCPSLVTRGLTKVARPRFDTCELLLTEKIQLWSAAKLQCKRCIALEPVAKPCLMLRRVPGPLTRFGERVIGYWWPNLGRAGDETG